VCVLARGDGYVVRSDDPLRWARIEVYPILEAFPVPSKGLLIFASHIELKAYGPQGPVWTTKRLAWSDMRILHFDADRLEGETWDIRSDETVRFSVDLATGEHTGGIRED
jgi:hypothetical protein